MSPSRREGNKKSGTQMQHKRESDADEMRRKQAAGMFNLFTALRSTPEYNHEPTQRCFRNRKMLTNPVADARKEAAGLKGKK
ncbi:hypothetical protein IL306_010045 [Fusarium sp. DS 682]|nr:hypothetical protein IL306_010045 [Fusarium sp. DS 682]